jgi:hypothetical protein
MIGRFGQRFAAAQIQVVPPLAGSDDWQVWSGWLNHHSECDPAVVQLAFEVKPSEFFCLWCKVSDLGLFHAT